MNMLSTFFKRSPIEASAAELEEALRIAETERQALREREQALAVERQDALLTGTDEDLDRIEAELVTVNRAAERHDLRIPELRRLYLDRQAAERRAADQSEFDQAVAQRLAIARQIDTALSTLGGLFDGLEATAVTLRRLDAYHGASRKIMGPMSDLRLDKAAFNMALLQHAPTIARAFKVEETGDRRRETFHSYEARIWSRLAAGPQPEASPQQPRPASDSELAALADARTLANRGA